MNLGTLTAHINADTRGLDKGMRKAERRMKQASRTIKRAAKVATAALAGIGASTAYMVKAASEAQELDNVMNQSFGSSAEAVNDWADDTADAMNRSIYQMRRFSAMNQAILKPMLGTSQQTQQMSKDLTKLAVDLGSFFNVADRQAFEAIQSGLMGMVRPLRQFGIDLTQATLEAYALEKGLDANIEKMSQAEKVQLRYNYLMENTGHIQGDAVRTAHTLENQLKRLRGEWRNLREALGSQFLPEATKVVTRTADIIQNLAELDEETLNNIKNFTMFTSKVLAAVAGLGLLVKTIEVVIGGLKILAGIFGIITSPIVLATAAIVAASTLLYTAWTENWNGIRDKTEKVWNQHLEPIYESMKDWFETAWNWTIKTAGNAWEWLTETSWKEKWEDIKQWMSAGWNWVINLAGDAWNWISEKAPKWSEGIETAWNWTIKFVEGIGNWIKNTAWPWIKENKPATTAWNWSINAVNELFTWVATTAWPWINSTVNTTWQWTIKGLEKIKDIISWTNRNIGENKLNVGDSGQSGRNTVPNPLNFGFRKAIDLFNWSKRNTGPGTGYLNGNKAGGYTGEQGVNDIAGVVHGQEYVIPADMVKQMPGVVKMLEKKRQGYKSGGGVGIASFGPTGSDNLSDLVGNMNFDEIGKWIQGLADNMDNITKVLSTGFDALLNMLVEVANIIGNALGQGNLGDKIRDTISGFRDTLQNIFRERDTTGETTRSRRGPVAFPGHMEDAWTKFIANIQVKWMEITDNIEAMWDNSLNAIENAKEWLQKPWREQLDDMGNAFANFVTGTDWKNIFSSLSSATQSIIGQGGGAGGGLSQMLSGNVGGGIMSMIQQSGTFQNVMEDLAPVLAEIANIVGEVFAPVLQLLKPILEVVADAFRTIGIIVLEIASFILDAWNFVASGIEMLLNGIIGLLNKIPFINIGKVSLTIDTSGVEESLKELKNGTEDTTDEMENMKKSMKNVPDIFKVAAESFTATQGRSIPSAAVGGTVRSSGIAEVHSGEIIANKSQQQAMGGNKTEVVIQGDIYGMDDFNRKVVQAVQRANKKRKKSEFGLGRT